MNPLLAILLITSVVTFGVVLVNATEAAAAFDALFQILQAPK